MPNPNYKLTYFDVKGLGEFIRYTFAFAGVPFEDVRIKKADWPELKDKQPYGTLPVLDIDGKKLTQSASICRYLGKKFGLTADDPFTDALLEALVDNVKDVSYKFISLRSNRSTEAYQEAIKAFNTLMVKIEPLAENGYFYGSKPTWADIYFTGTMDTFNDHEENVLGPYPKLQALCDRIKSNDGIQKYIKQRPAPENFQAA